MESPAFSQRSWDIVLKCIQKGISIQYLLWCFLNSTCQWTNAAIFTWAQTLFIHIQYTDAPPPVSSSPSGAEPVWWWAAESRSHSVFGETSWCLPDRRAFSLPGLWAEIDGRQGHQEVLLLLPQSHLSLSLSLPFPAALPIPFFSFPPFCCQLCLTPTLLCVFAGTSSTRRRLHLWWSMTSSWRPTWLTESLCSMVFHPRRPRLTRKNQNDISKGIVTWTLWRSPWRWLNLSSVPRVCWLGWTGFCRCWKSHLEEIQTTSGRASTSSIPSRYKQKLYWRGFVPNDQKHNRKKKQSSWNHQLIES